MALGFWQGPPRVRVSGLVCFLVVCVLVSLLVPLTGCQSGGSLADTTPVMEKIKSRGRLVAGVKFDSKPFGYLDGQGNLQGFDIDLMHELAKRILGDPEAVEFQQVLTSTRILALDTGNVDVVAATMTITPEREKIIDFSEPYFEANQAIAVPTQSTVRSVDDLNGKRVLYVLGSTSEATIRKRLKEGEYFGFKTSTDAFGALKAKRGDAMTTDDTILAGFLANSCEFRLLPDRLSKEPYGLGFRQDERHNTSQGFRQKVNETLKAMRADGTLARLEKKWMAPYQNIGAQCPKTKAPSATPAAARSQG